MNIDASRAMRFSDGWCDSHIQSRCQTMALARDMMLGDSILMVIVTAFVTLSRETRKLVRRMLAVAGNAGLG